MTKLIFYPDKHIYMTEQGEEVPSVTTILQMVSNIGYKDINAAIIQQAAMRGTLVHEATELRDYGMDYEDMDFMTPELFGYLKAYECFLRDYKPQWKFIEKVVYNDELNYCGTVDRIGVIDGRPTVLDIKTNASPTVLNKITVSAQTAAYAMAFTCEALEYEGQFDFKKGIRRKALYLKKNGSYNLMDCTDFDSKKGMSGYDMFNDCLELYKEIKKIESLSKRRQVD